MTRIANGRSALLAVSSLALVLAIALPASGADPTARPDASGSTKGNKPDKGPEIAQTLKGTVASKVDDKGRPTFTLTVDGVTWELSVGPKWYWLDKNPLAAFVGKTVTVVGTHHANETDLDVDTIDGKAIRAPGRPPWAGGPNKVGKSHPGNGHGRAGAPGQTKDKTHPNGSEGPDESEAPDASESPATTG